MKTLPSVFVSSLRFNHMWAVANAKTAKTRQKKYSLNGVLILNPQVRQRHTQRQTHRHTLDPSHLHPTQTMVMGTTWLKGFLATQMQPTATTNITGIQENILLHTTYILLDYWTKSGQRPLCSPQYLWRQVLPVLSCAAAVPHCHTGTQDAFNGGSVKVCSWDESSPFQLPVKEDSLLGIFNQVWSVHSPWTSCCPNTALSPQNLPQQTAFPWSHSGRDMMRDRCYVSSFCGDSSNGTS